MTIELAAFDVDGTIKNKQGIPNEILEGFSHLRARKIHTTILTGRGLSRLQETLYGYWHALVTPDVPLCLENGGRLVDSEGRRNLSYSPLSISEIEAITPHLTQEYIRFLAYFPEELKDKAVVWCPTEQSIGDIGSKLGHFAKIICEPIDKLMQRIIVDHPCMLNLQLSNSGVRSELPLGLNLAFNEGVLNMNAEGVNKAQALDKISNYTSIPYESILVAGNDENDLPMLKLGVGQKIFVGNPFDKSYKLPVGISLVDNPQALGRYLQLL